MSMATPMATDTLTVKGTSSRAQHPFYLMYIQCTYTMYIPRTENQPQRHSKSAIKARAYKFVTGQNNNALQRLEHSHADNTNCSQGQEACAWAGHTVQNRAPSKERPSAAVMLQATAPSRSRRTCIELKIQVKLAWTTAVTQHSHTCAHWLGKMLHGNMTFITIKLGNQLHADTLSCFLQ